MRAAARLRTLAGVTAFLRYTALRLLLFVAVAGLLYLAGLRGLLLVALAVLVSGVASLILLTRQRDQMALAVQESYGRMRANVEAKSRAEDAD